MLNKAQSFSTQSKSSKNKKNTSSHGDSFSTT